MGSRSKGGGWRVKSAEWSKDQRDSWLRIRKLVLKGRHRRYRRKRRR